MLGSLNPSAPVGFCGLLIAALLLVTGCSQSSNPVGYQVAGDGVEDQSEHIALEIPEEALEALKRAGKTAPPISSMAKNGEDVVAYTYDDLDLDCRFNTEFPSVYRDTEFSDSRLLARCSFDGGTALVPTDLARFNNSSVARNLITLPIPATAVSIDAFAIRQLGPRNFVAYDAAGNEIDRESFSSSTDRVRLTVTGAIHQVAIIDYQAQTYWDNLTVTYGEPSDPLVVDAGPDQQVIVTEVATLAGSASGGPDNEALTFAWSWTAIPDGSHAVFSDPSSAVTSFTADLPGTYSAQLVANDGTSGSAPDEVVVVALQLSDAIALLGDEVSKLQEDGVLTARQSTSLQKMLDFVLQKMDAQPGVALNKLKAFTGHVAGLVDDGVLSQEQGDALINYANRIAAALQVEQEDGAA